MNMVDLAEDYLIDPNEGMRKITASYLNEVMQLVQLGLNKPNFRQ
jgi:putative transposase